MGREVKGILALDGMGVSINARADRIDRTPSGELVIYDYKTGKPPSQRQQLTFERQLLLEALIAERAGFEGIAPAPVAQAVYIGLGSTPMEVPAPLDEIPPEALLGELRALIGHFMQPSAGYTARLAMEKDRFGSDYDHLSRYGEWDETSAPERTVLT